MLKKKRKLLLVALALCMTIPAMALLKTTVFSNNKNTISSGNSTKYDVIADLGEGGRFESGEFVKLDANRWIYKYLPMNKPTPIPKPVKDGYTFEGWLVNGDPTPKPDYTIPAWHKGNINITAKWKSSDRILLRGEEFNSKIKAMSNFANVTEIKFAKSTPNSGGTDLSETQDGSIRASISGNVLTIACNNQIYANPDSSKMFKDMSNLVSINLTALNTSKVTDMSYMFNVQTVASNWDSYTAKITNIYGLNQMDTSKVTNMAHMFHGCSSMSSIDVSRFNTSKVTDMSSMFEGCESVTRLDITNFNTNSLTKMDCIFKKCKKVVNIVGHENINTSKVTSLEDVFYYCRALKNINVAKWNVDNVTCGYRTFCAIDEPGTTIRGLENWNVSKLTDMRSMFSSLGVSNLNGIRNWDTSNVTNMRWTFNGIGSKTRHDFDTSIFPYLDYSKVEIGEGIFKSIKTNNYVIQNMTFPSAVDFSGLIGNDDSITTPRIYARNLKFKRGCDLSGAFGSRYLEYLDLTGFNTSYADLTAFISRGLGLRTIVGLEKLDFRGVTSVINAFRDCKNLTGRITINNPNLVYKNNSNDPWLQQTSNMLWSVASDSNSRFYVDYTRGCREMAQKLVDGATGTSNVYLGRFVDGPSTPLNPAASSYKSDSKSIRLKEVGRCYGEITNDAGDRYLYKHFEGIPCENCDFGHEKSTLQQIKDVFVKESQPQQQMSINLTLNNGPSAQYPKQVIEVENGKIPQLNPPELNPQYAGQFGGYYYDPQFTKPVKQGDIVTKDLTIYARW